MEAQGVDLDRRLDTWSEQAAWRHLAAPALIALVAVIRWHQCLFLDAPLIDEATYLEAFRAVAGGGSPYEIGSYHYTPVFAWAGARLLSIVGDSGVLLALRSASVLGLAAAVWCSCAWLSLAWRWRLCVAAAYVLVAPAVGAGFCTGNVSFAVIGVIVLALMAWSRYAAPSGLALGATVAAKPLAPLALIALFFHRPQDDGLARPRRLAGALGGVTAALLLAPMVTRIAEMASQPIHRLSYARSFSLDRILGLVGVDTSPVWLMVLAAIALALVIRRGALDRSRLVAVAVTASVLATPIIWDHTLVLTLPLQVMALALAFARFRVPGGRQRLYELILVALAALALQFAGGFGAVDELPRLTQLAFLSVPYLAPAALLAYVLRGSKRANL